MYLHTCIYIYIYTYIYIYIYTSEVAKQPVTEHAQTSRRRTPDGGEPP